MVLMISLLLLPDVASRNIIVDCGGGSNHEQCGWTEAPCGTIQHALDKAKDGDMITISSQRCAGAGNKDLTFRGKELEVVGRPGEQMVEIDCEGSGRAFVFNHNEGSYSIVRSLTMRNCHAENGGAVACDNASPLFEKCRFISNTADGGGGAIYWDLRGPRLEHCSFEDNQAVYGADIASSVQTLRIDNAPEGAIESKQLFRPPLELVLLDHYNQVVSSLSGPTVQVSVHVPRDRGGAGKNPAAVAPGLAKAEQPEHAVWAEGETTRAVREGRVTMGGLKVVGKPGTEVLVRFGYKGWEIEVDLRLALRACVAGEEEVEQSYCSRCPRGHYSALVSVRCAECPNGVICLGGDEIVARRGYAITSRSPLTVARCPIPKACEGGPNSACAPGFMGDTCAKCAGGRSNCFGDCVQGFCWPLGLIVATVACGVVAFTYYVLNISVDTERELVQTLVAADRKSVV